jgi:hypothetical protein
MGLLYLYTTALLLPKFSTKTCELSPSLSGRFTYVKKASAH